MPRILIAEDDKVTSNDWRRLVTDFLTKEEKISAALIKIDQAFNYTSTLDHLEDYEYDLVLLDHKLDSRSKSLTGVSVLKKAEERNEGINILFKKFIVLTGYDDSDVARDYERFGSLEQLIKPISEAQFKVAMIRAWTKLRLGEEESDWEEAYSLLSELGLVQSAESLQQDVDSVAGIQDLYDELKQQLSGKIPEEQLAAYDAARKALSSNNESIASILPCLEGYEMTEQFLKDVRRTFRMDRLAFWILRAYLHRFKQQDGRVRNLNTGTHNHAEYRISRNYRLYFSERENDRVLERFAHKNKQVAIIDNLCKSSSPIALNIEQLLMNT